MLISAPSSAKDNNATQTRIDAFEQEWQRLSKTLEREKDKNKAYVFPKELQENLTGEQQCILEWYSKADTLSLYFQQKTLKTLKGLFWLVFFAVIAFELYAHLWQDRVAILMFYPILMILSYMLFIIAKKSDWENKYFDYRALAEGLRVQFFWKMSGIEEPCADHYMHIQKTEMEWIRDAMNKYCGIITERPASSSPPSTGQSLKLVLKHWVEDQYKFFLNRAPLNRKNKKFYERLIAVFFFVSPLISLALIFPGYFSIDSHPTNHEIIVGVAITLLIAALLTGYSEKRAFSALARRYDWMKDLFGKDIVALENLLRGEEYEEARELIKKLGREALLENGNWLLMNRERPLEVPKA